MCSFSGLIGGVEWVLEFKAVCLIWDWTIFGHLLDMPTWRIVLKFPSIIVVSAKQFDLSGILLLGSGGLCLRLSEIIPKSEAHIKLNTINI